MQFILRETQPQKLFINGVEYPAIWSMRAIAKMEEYTESYAGYILARFNQRVFLAKELIGAVCGMLSAAGVVYPEMRGDGLARALEISIRPEDREEIGRQVMEIIKVQGDQPDGEQKNA